MMHKRQIKVQAMQPDLPRAIIHGARTAEIGFIGIGMTHGVILEAQEILAERGFSVQYHQPQTLWPMLDETPGPLPGTVGVSLSSNTTQPRNWRNSSLRMAAKMRTSKVSCL
ncbi:MAG: hypothetical protein CM1200mP20_09810 [Pseudomonadota bacterium]|nr:MAG: hypothetical protein CM1200mP20_09810 [Pseudomonadota bacterium]